MSFIATKVTPLAAAGAGGDTYFYAEYVQSSTPSNSGTGITIAGVDVDGDENIYVGGNSQQWKANDTTQNYFVLKINSTTGEIDWVNAAGYNNEGEAINGLIYDSYNDDIFTYGNAGGGNSNSFAVAGSTVFRRWTKDGTFKNLLLNGSPYPGTASNLVTNGYNKVAISPLDGDIFGIISGDEIRVWTYNDSTNTYSTPVEWKNSVSGYGNIDEIFWQSNSTGPIVCLDENLSNGDQLNVAKLNNWATPQGGFTSLKEYGGSGVTGNRFSTSGGVNSQLGRKNSSGHVLRTNSYNYASSAYVGYVTMNTDASGRYVYCFSMSDKNNLQNGRATWADGSNIICQARSYDGSTNKQELWSVPENSTSHNWRLSISTTSPSSNIEPRALFKISETRFGVLSMNENDPSGRRRIELLVLPMDGSVTGTFSRSNSNNVTISDTSSGFTLNNQAVGNISEFTRSVTSPNSFSTGTMNVYTSNPESSFSVTLNETVTTL